MHYKTNCESADSLVYYMIIECKGLFFIYQINCSSIADMKWVEEKDDKILPIQWMVTTYSFAIQKNISYLTDVS